MSQTKQIKTCDILRVTYDIIKAFICLITIAVRGVRYFSNRSTIYIYLPIDSRAEAYHRALSGADLFLI